MDTRMCRPSKVGLPSVLMLMGALMIAVSCGPSTPPQPASQAGPGAPGAPAAAPASPVPKPLVKIRAAYPTLTTPFLSLWVAQESGAFGKHGLEVELNYLAPGQQIAAALTGENQIGGTSVESLVGAFLGNADVVIVAVNYQKLTSVVVGSPDVKTGQDLKGKRVGITNPGSVSDFAMRRALEHFGLDPDRDVEILQTRELGVGFAALQSGAIQGYTLYPPDDLAAKKLGLNILLDQSQQNLPYSQATIFTTRSYLKENREVVMNYLKGQLEGIKRLKTDAAFATKVFMDYAKTEDREVAEWAVAAAAKNVPRVPMPNLDGMQNVLKVMSTERPDAPGVDLSALVDRSLLEEIVRSGFVDRLWASP